MSERARRFFPFLRAVLANSKESTHPAGSRTTRPPCARRPARCRSAPRPPCSAPWPSCCPRPSACAGEVERGGDEKIRLVVVVCFFRGLRRRVDGIRSDCLEVSGAPGVERSDRSAGANPGRKWGERGAKNQHTKTRRRGNAQNAQTAQTAQNAPKHKVVRAEDLAVGAAAHAVHGSGLEVHEDGAGDVAACRFDLVRGGRAEKDE